MTGKIRACCRGFQDPVVTCVYQVNKQGFGNRVFMAVVDHYEINNFYMTIISLL